MSRIIVVVLFALSLIYSEEIKEEAVSKKESARNVVEFHPVKLLSGVSFGYEHIFGDNFGVMVEGQAILWNILGDEVKGFSGTLFAPIHLTKSKRNILLSSPYFTPFVKYFTYDAKSDYIDEYSGELFGEETYDVDAVYLGVSFGRRWVTNSGISLGFRVGYGYPVMFKSESKMYIFDFNGEKIDITDEIYGEIDGNDEWSKVMRDEIELEENIIKYKNGLDLQFKIGFAF